MAWQNGYKVHHKLHFEVTISKKENIKADIGLQPRERLDASIQKGRGELREGSVHILVKSPGIQNKKLSKLQNFISVKYAISDFGEVNKKINFSALLWNFYNSIRQKNCIGRSYHLPSS